MSDLTCCIPFFLQPCSIPFSKLSPLKDPFIPLSIPLFITQNKHSHPFLAQIYRPKAESHCIPSLHIPNVKAIGP